MKKSSFKKELSATGIGGTVTAEIIVSMNYSSKLKGGTNAITHDDYNLNIPIHMIEALVNGKRWKKIDGLESESMVLTETEKLLKQVKDHIYDLASEEPIKSFTDKMNDLLNNA